MTLGLALQSYTPFRFSIKKIWCSFGLHESEYSFKNYDIMSFINPNVISLITVKVIHLKSISNLNHFQFLTHLCLKDLFMVETPSDISNLCAVLEKLNNLVGISLIRVLNFYPTKWAWPPPTTPISQPLPFCYFSHSHLSYSNEEIKECCARINKSLRRNYKLKKIDFSFNFLRSRLFSLLSCLVQPLEYLNLQDCRLDHNDICFLNTPLLVKVLKSCKELNLSMNDFSHSYSSVFSLMSNCTHLNCLSISHCQIPVDVICEKFFDKVILANPKQFSQLKYVMIQPFTPPKMSEIVVILGQLSMVKSLQKMSFLPSLYAFPGNTDTDREANAIQIIRACAGILEAKGRTDIDFVDF